MALMATPNSTLRAVRLGLLMSQDDFARAVRDAGTRVGQPNDANKRLVQRWESGKTGAPRPVYARALETLGVDWAKVLPIPKTNAERFPEVKKLLDLGLQSKQYSFDLTAASEAGKIFQGMSPSKDGTQLDASEQAPAGVPITIAEERYEEFSPGLDPELLSLIQATADLEMAEVQPLYGPVAP